ncbi:hypothetical protein D1872_223450 [compost metagenome]
MGTENTVVLVNAVLLFSDPLCSSFDADCYESDRAALLSYYNRTDAGYGAIFAYIGTLIL